MIVLGIETASLDVGVAIADDEGPRASFSARAGRKHAEALHPMIQHACDIAGVTLQDLSAVAVDVGPGLFTGIRVGLAAAKGFGVALGIPLVPLTSLEILDRALGDTALTSVPMVDMRRGELAWAARHPGEGEELSLPQLSSAEQVNEALGRFLEDGRQVLVAGDGALRYGGLFPAGVRIAGPELAAPPVASLAVRGVSLLAAGIVADPLEVQPVYLREPDARINWSKMHEGRA